MNYVLIYEKEELKGKKYFILKEVSLCEIGENGAYILMGEHKGEFISNISSSNEDLLQVDIISFEKLKEYYETSDMEEINMQLAYNINLPFIFNEKEELVNANENLYTYEKLTDKIIGHDNQIKKILSVIYSNQVLNSSSFTKEEKKVSKRNMVVMGKTGVGKSLIFKELKENIDLPICVTRLEEEDNASNMLNIFVNLLKEADGDYDLASRGIVVIDNLSDAERYTALGDMVLLAGKYNFNYLLEAGPVIFEIEEEKINFDFSDLTFIFLVNTENRKVNDKKVGFENETEKTNNSLDRYFANETINRITDLVILDDFNKETYMKILLESSISPLYIKIEKLKELGINFKYDLDFISSIAERALKINQGAFGLIKAVNEVFSDYEFDIITNDCEEIEFKGNKLVRKI